MELDILVQKSDGRFVAIEFNGRQHYQFVKFFHRKIENFHSQLYRDLIKAKLCDELGIELIVIPYHLFVQ